MAISNFYSPTRLAYGCDALSQMHTLVRKLGMTRVLVVGDRHIAKQASPL